VQEDTESNTALRRRKEALNITVTLHWTSFHALRIIERISSVKRAVIIKYNLWVLMMININLLAPELFF